jgi:hypothetical protein
VHQLVEQFAAVGTRLDMSFEFVRFDLSQAIVDKLLEQVG